VRRIVGTLSQMEKLSQALGPEVQVA
jgi:hypothetical protein